MTKFTTLNHPERECFPEIRLDLNRKLIACNLTAMPLLNEWKWNRGGQLPEAVMAEYPLLASCINELRDDTLTVKFKGLNLSFDIIPYPEAGYIGLYGFHVETVVPENIHRKIQAYRKGMSAH